jgi:hypothetical protein
MHGKRLLARYQIHSQEKPLTPLHTEREVFVAPRTPKATEGHVPTLHGRAKAQDTLNGVVSGIVRQLRVFTES